MSYASDEITSGIFFESQKDEVKNRITADRASKRTSTVLYVDDEEYIVEFARETLERSGYSVFSALNGAEAVEVFELHQDEINAVVLDLTMPLMSGKEAFERMKSIDPQCRFIASSGSKDPRSDMSLNLPVEAYLEKPYRAETLLETIRKVLDNDNG